jgi:hypothetical protein
MRYFYIIASSCSDLNNLISLSQNTTMKITKTALQSIFLLLFFSSTISQAQDREEAVLPRFTQRTVSILPKQITGWTKDMAGKWVSNKGMISTYALLGEPSDEEMSHHESFRWMRFAVLPYKGKNYRILSFCDVQGQYKYPAIQEDWFYYNVVNTIVLSEEDYQKFQSDIKAKSSVNLRLGSSLTSFTYEGDANETQTIVDLTKAIDNGARDKGVSQCLLANSQTTKDGDVVRFRKPGYCSSQTDEDFKVNYFEMPLNEFVKIFTISTDPADDAASSQASIAKTWKTSADTLRVANCKWTTNDKKSTLIDEFKWASMSAFTYNKEKYYCLSYDDGKQSHLAVLKEKVYNDIKAALSALTPGDQYWDVRYTIDFRGGEKTKEDIYKELSGELKSEKVLYHPCLGLSIKKGKVKFRMPQGDCDKFYGLSTGLLWHSYECDLAEFSKLFAQ